jgi:hypothetical protein
MAAISSDEAAAAAPPAVPAPQSGGFTAGLRRISANFDVQELCILLSVVALGCGLRILKLQPIEYYDDEVTRWHFVREWFYSHDFRHGQWTHHMARFGLNVPVFVMQALFGRKAHVYYYWPVASFTLQVALVYLTAKKLGGRGAAVLAALFLSVFGGLDRGASQLLPDTFSCTAMVLVCYLLARYQEADLERRMSWLIGTGLAFVWAYEIKESNLLFLPGTAAAVWLCRGRFRDGVWFCCVLFAAIALETLAFRLFTQYSSRFAIVGEAHGDIAAAGFWTLFDRFTRLEPAWQMLFWMWLPSALWLAGSRDRRLQSLVLIPASFIFLLTFLVRSIHPMVIWTRFYSRYFDPVAPLLVIAVALFVAEGAKRLWPSVTPARLHSWPARMTRHAAACALVVCALVGLVEYAQAKASLPEHPLLETRRISAITNDAYRRNLPIVELRAKRGELEERRVRPLKLVYGVYLNDAQVATSDLARGGRLPEILDAVRDGKRYSYVLHDARAYRGHDLETWINQGCAVVLHEQKNHLNAAPGVPSLIVEQNAKLPESCRAPEAQP